MNYSEIIIDGYEARNVTPLVAYFKQNAQIAKRDNFVEFVDFFIACRKVTTGYKDHIKHEWYKRLNNCYSIVEKIDEQLERNGYVTIDEERITDRDNARIADIVNYATKEFQFINEQGYKNNADYPCRITATWGITEKPYETRYTLSWPDLEDIEQAMQQAEQELTSENNNMSKQPQTVQTNGNEIDKPQRTINVEELSKYFDAKFKGIGSNINYFDTMIDDLKTERTAKELAEIAYLIYRGNKMNARKPKTFAKWYKIFCECIGVSPSNGYKPNNLRNPSETLRKLFNYLY